MGKARATRRKVLLDREFQLRFIRRLGGLMLLYFFMFLCIAAIAPLTLGLLGVSPEWAEMMSSQHLGMLVRVFLAPALFTIICVFAHGVIETFRIAGPSFRFRTVFESLQARGIPRGVRIREGDYMHNTAQAFDKALTVLHDDLAELSRAGQQAAGALEDVPRGAWDKALGEVRASVCEINAILERYTLLSAAPHCQPLEPAQAAATAAEAVVEPLSEPVAEVDSQH